jgi:hypothetical protein
MDFNDFHVMKSLRLAVIKQKFFADGLDMSNLVFVTAHTV